MSDLRVVPGRPGSQYSQAPITSTVWEPAGLDSGLVSTGAQCPTRHTYLMYIHPVLFSRPILVFTS